ncbi:unnamed protein product [Hydatigera taeniaeformis]|uniref:AflR domain-containing protein n=1 Tax=Hydatigena taeniaeformis TaxID=6205 RepID=A0A0R3WSE6_HYDTA|nr:unnamed protein product [Hydatigera taeniaeformis]
MNRTAFKEVIQLAHDLTSIRVAVGFIADLMRQATHALKVETTIVPQQSGCSADLHHIASRLLVDFLEAQERWSDFSFTSTSASTYTPGLVIDDTSPTNTSANADVELRLVECFFAAQSIGTRLQSHLRDLIQSLQRTIYHADKAVIPPFAIPFVRFKDFGEGKKEDSSQKLIAYATVEGAMAAQACLHLQTRINVWFQRHA